jgi:hypothetical protein
VDIAMDERRPEKETMRGLWAEAVRTAKGTQNGPPLYLTLPGANGLDIEHLINAGMLRLAENDRAIAPEDIWKVVAVERSNAACLELRKRWSGLRVLNEDIRGVLASTGPLRWPQGDRELWCRAHVVNLDLNSSLTCERDAAGKLVFPTVQVIWKLAQLHMKNPALDWILCLTVAANITWQLEDCRLVQRFLKENFRNEEVFAAESRALLGERFFKAIVDEEALDMKRISASDQQRLLMVFVPKKIVTETYGLGWSIATSHNLRYGKKPMVSWLMRFAQEPRAASEPRAVYSESLAETLSNAGSIGPDGELQLN